MRQFFRDTEIFLTKSERELPDLLSRLDSRYQAVVEQGLGAIQGARILDIASHDGRWSAACLANGANHVTGIEAREHLARKAERQLARFAGPGQSYRFHGRRRPLIDTEFFTGPI